MSDLINPENWGEVDGDAKAKRWDYWNLIYAARRDFIKQVESTVDTGSIPESFDKHMLDEYGLRMMKDSGGNYTADYAIVDEHKYLMFRLKYS